jgi:hypothetical protein
MSKLQQATSLREMARCATMTDASAIALLKKGLAMVGGDS